MRNPWKSRPQQPFSRGAATESVAALRLQLHAGYLFCLHLHNAVALSIGERTGNILPWCEQISLLTLGRARPVEGPDPHDHRCPGSRSRTAPRIVPMAPTVRTPDRSKPGGSGSATLAIVTSPARTSSTAATRPATAVPCAPAPDPAPARLLIFSGCPRPSWDISGSPYGVCSGEVLARSRRSLLSCRRQPRPNRQRVRCETDAPSGWKMSSTVTSKAAARANATGRLGS